MFGGYEAAGGQIDKEGIFVTVPIVTYHPADSSRANIVMGAKHMPHRRRRF
jgi:hypothetical protein